VSFQQQLKSATPERKAAIMRALEPHLRRLAEDKHGNFLVQRASEWSSVRLARRG
jgi:hypothetical protein